ncbi:Sensory box histidine kinase and response regulator protein [Desulfamplus magnetovallimortis]|uniref:histidine kinase n=1 Tax=Desulfamplus magnetovallimortis TaxID=1246637 RepID=A0A1W1H6H2_9BACT|nr:hybrid sensor histidine kinase/response regulator [Desulfamplus magnetovallimortis]SLM28059.1 Sensory box histidine kinase and response regulator protein [Desulfamplus magnetovallimortis]
MTSDGLKKILLVDDEQDIREVLGITLEDMGFEVFTAENGQKAMELFDKQDFSIILTDIKMPVMDGIELLKKIKFKSPLTEVIMITGHGDMDLAIESFRHEAVEFITKPVDVTKLEVAIRRAEEKIEIRKGIQEYTHNLENLLWSKTEALKKAEQKKKQPASTLNRDKKDITAIMETLPLIIFFVDENLKISLANNLFKEKFGDYDDRYCHELCMDKKAPCDDCPAILTFKNGTSHQIEKKFLTAIRDKTDRNVAHQDISCEESQMSYLVWTSPILNESSSQGKKTGTISTIDEKSSKAPQKKAVSEVLIMATDISKVLDIQDHLASLGLMIGSVSHGIKGLLTGLDGGVYLLNAALNKDDQALAQEGLDMVKQMTSKIRKMILDILFYAKERELYIEDIPATAFALDLASVIKPKAEKNGISFTLNLPEQDFTFRADSAILHAALVNILDNAVDACAEDKDSSKKTEKGMANDKEAKDPTISFELQKIGNSIQFVISDNGVGMEQDEIKKAFTLFHSGKGKKGTGLGLFISNKAVQQHKGTIRATSAKGVGTSFFVTIPMMDK